MRTIKFTYWQDGDFLSVSLMNTPTIRLRALPREELAENLKDLLSDFESGKVPHVRKTEELLVA
ncbi:MAG: hypothetical protein Q8P42_01430 [Gallionella sp.]|nr:hypothetical protein [Gallionella sp.]